MTTLDDIFDLQEEELISSLPGFQTKILKELLAVDSDHLSVADKWLNAKPSNTVGFGGAGIRNHIYRDKILEELEKFVCGDEKYQLDREKLGSATNGTVQYIIGSIATAIGSTMGITGAVIAPVIVLLLITGGKISKNGWCEARRAIRAASQP